MTKWKEMLHKEQKYLQELLNQLEKQEKRNLAGRLRISSDRGYPRYYHCKGDDKRGVYISKKNLELARQLAQKEYDEKLQKYIAKRLKQVGKILKSDTEEEIDEVYETLHGARKQLVTPIQPTWEQQLEQWKKESYQGKEFLGDSIVIYTEKGERVRSKSEKILRIIFTIKGFPINMKNLFYFRDLALYIRILRFYRRGQEGKFTGNMTEKWTIRLMQKAQYEKLIPTKRMGYIQGKI